MKLYSKIRQLQEDIGQLVHMEGIFKDKLSNSIDFQSFWKAGSETCRDSIKETYIKGAGFQIKATPQAENWRPKEDIHCEDTFYSHSSPKKMCCNSVSGFRVLKTVSHEEWRVVLRQVRALTESVSRRVSQAAEENTASADIAASSAPRTADVSQNGACSTRHARCFEERPNVWLHACAVWWLAALLSETFSLGVCGRVRKKVFGCCPADLHTLKNNSW